MALDKDIIAKLRDLAGLIKQKPTFRWGIVVQASPLRVQLDGDIEPMALTPQTTIRGLSVGQRVACMEQHRRVIVIDGGDTGWIDLSPYLVSGASGPVMGRRIGGMVEINGTASASVASGVPTNILAGIPEVLRPSMRNRWGALYANGWPGAVGIRPDGSGTLIHRAGSTVTTNHQFSISYLTE